MDSLVPQSSAFQVALLLFMEYVDLGKLVAAIEGGSCFGLGLLLLLFYNCTAVLLQCLASYISLVTGKDLAQVCSEQYSRLSFVLLGTAIELSMIASDVTKILSVAYGFHVLFEMDLFTCTSLASILSVVLPIFVFSLGYHNLKVLHVSIAIFSSLFYVLGVHLIQLETSFSPHKAYSDVNLKNAHTVMALLGAQIVPHNFYIQPYIIQLQRKQLDASMSVVLQTHLFTFVGSFCIQQL
ncbi:uncharacterized protein A4U43_C04F620 [Asparagus officinalis]|uniref:Uncharacterized protein n=1 Tax=Asparagus officinalis TaxID=4686 RepID=A0A5P1F2P1_ASPOF|nr:protein ETHYLENE-INSENSITIVE 2-like [Asparagus officinalis]ONK70700.1 uncharacterized protein A4U43_C04F620 [Asparagus officinalis]